MLEPGARVETNSRAAPVHFKINRLSHRRLDAELIEIDVELQTWAAFARPYYARRFPIGPDPDPTSSPPREEWPAAVLELDDQVQKLCWRLASAVLAHYLVESKAARAEAYARLIGYFGSRGPSRPKRATGEGTFRADIDRARWSLRLALGA
jgi:hypothetical protein